MRKRVLCVGGDRARPAPALGEFVAANREEILRRWAERVRRAPGAPSPADAAVREDIPALVDALAGSCRCPAAPGPPRARPDTGRIAHGRDIERVVAEHDALREAILDVGEAAGLGPTVAEVRVLGAALSRGVARGAGRLAARRERVHHAAAARHRAMADRRLRDTLGRFRAIADRAPIALFVKDASGRYEFVNQLFGALLGRPGAEIVGHLDAEVLSPELVAFFEPLARRAAAGEVVELEDRLPEAGGRLVHMVKFPLAGEPGAIAGFALDVTERRRSERRLEEAHRFERQVIGIVSHDLRNPLSAIRMGVASIRGRPDVTEPVRTALVRIDASVERAARLIRDLLDVSRARLAGGMPIYPREADARAVAEQAIDDVRAGWPGREVSLDARGDCAGRWDPDRLSQAIANLVTNAIVHGSPTSRVAVSMRAVDGAVEIEVHNEGEPIPPEEIPRLFEPWARGESAVARGRRGAGLGLFIVDRIAKAHGGAVRVASSREGGTTFTIVLPRAAPPEP